jgi:hypothetical protein
MNTAVLRKAAYQLGTDQKPDLVVKCTPYRQCTAERCEAGVDGHRAADLHNLLGLLTRGDTDVDPKLLQRRRLVRIGRLERLDRLATYHPQDAFMSVNPDALPYLGRNIGAAYGAEEQETVFIDVVDDKAYLIHMAGIHEAHFRVWIEDGANVAHDISRDFVGKGLNIVSIELRHRLLEAAG